MEMENRKSPRFPVRDNAFAFFKYKPAKLIPIVDISLGGMGIGLNGINMKAEELSGLSHLEILTEDCRFYMDRLPYKLLIPSRRPPQNTADTLQHIYGIEFIDLVSSQRNQLKIFIRNHTCGGMMPNFVQRFNRQLLQLIGKKDFEDACSRRWLQRPTI